MSVPDLSVVIPVYDNWWLTARCLRVLDALRERCAIAFETIVVDNASSDETPRAIQDFPWVKFIRHDVNRNFAGACNAGVAAATAPVALLLNNDAYPLDDALTPIAQAFGRPEVVIAGGALFFEDGVTQAAGLVVLRNGHWHYSCRDLPPSLDGVTSSRDAVAVSGAAMAVRTAWFLDGGGFDESYLNGFEDVDLCMRARSQGHAIAYVAQARFAHYEAASQGRFDRERENEARFYGRWETDMASIPRVERGAVGAISIRSDAGASPLVDAAREDLEAALRSFGHPIVRTSISPWRRLDRRFREAAELGWFSHASSPSVVVQREGERTTLSTRGAASVQVPWLPCASRERLNGIALLRSPNPHCSRVGFAGTDRDFETFKPAQFASAFLRITPEQLLGTTPPLDVACVVHLGVTDDAAFGTVLLAQAGVPAIVLRSDELAGMIPSDVSVWTDLSGLRGAIDSFVADNDVRERYGRLIASDASRRFTPRRSAIRVVDLLCAARFGLERPAPATTNSPLSRSARSVE